MPESLAGLLFVASLALALVVVHRPLGDLLHWIATSPRDLAPERLTYRFVGADPQGEQSWTAYARSVLAFSAISVLFLYALLRLQQHLLLGLGFPGVPPAQAWNTAVSFVTNTNWQSYSGEATMSAAPMSSSVLWKPTGASTPQNSSRASRSSLGPP